MHLKAAYFLIFFPLMGTGYNYCGNDLVSIFRHPINKLDEACRKHKIVYMLYPNDLKDQMEADKRLIGQAWDRVFATDNDVGEKDAAWLMLNVIKAKREGTIVKNHGKFNGKVNFQGYNYCGYDLKTINPLPINELDEACRKQKMVYRNSNSPEEQMEADSRLITQAWDRVIAVDSNNSEKVLAWLVVNGLKAKNGWRAVKNHGIFKGEVHIPNYKFCGPGTDLSYLTPLPVEELKKLGINKLDQYCLWHDMVYQKNPNVEKIIAADRDLAMQAGGRIRDSDSSIGEKASAFVVVTGMVFKQPYNYVRSWFS